MAVQNNRNNPPAPWGRAAVKEEVMACGSGRSGYRVIIAIMSSCWQSVDRLLVGPGGMSYHTWPCDLTPWATKPFQQASKPASTPASKPASKPASQQASQPASKPAPGSKPASKPASQHAGMPASKQPASQQSCGSMVGAGGKGPSPEDE